MIVLTQFFVWGKLHEYLKKKKKNIFIIVLYSMRVGEFKCFMGGGAVVDERVRGRIADG